MDPRRRAALLVQVDELERRDEALAGMLAELATLTDDVQAVRLHATETVAARESLPAERASAEDERNAANAAVTDAARAVALAEGALRDVESARKPNEEEIERARRDVVQASAEHHDASARRERADARLLELDELETALAARSEGLVVTANAITPRLQAAPRVADAGKGEPGQNVADLDEWGARARAALFVAHSTLASERERVLHEANGLAASVLGDIGALSVALVKERLTQLS